MKVWKLKLHDFRNIREVSIDLDKHLNFFMGANGQGKTSIIEALSYLATLRSFRGATTDEVIRNGTTGSDISCVIREDQKEEWSANLKIIFSSESKTKKTAFINDKPYKSSTSYLSQRFGNYQLGLHAICFNPSDHELVRGEPTIRRSYLNRVIAAEEIEYLKRWQKYQRVLEQRNQLLKTEGTISKAVLHGFNEPLCRLGCEITRRRFQWLSRLTERLGSTAQRIAPRQPFLRAFYVSSWAPSIAGLSIDNNNLEAVHFTGQEALPSLELLEQTFNKKLAALEEVELRTRTTMVGPHRDDWTFFLGDNVLKGRGSQGEVRSTLLALKLSEIEMFREATGHRPLFLLDDFSSELDQERRDFLMKFLLDTDLQVFVTTTEHFANHSGKQFRVIDGKVQ